MTIGEKIKNLRREKHITQEELGKFLYVTYQAVSKWETNETMPDISLLPKIADYFEITIDELFNRGNSLHRSGYKSHREQLLTIYEINGSEEDFKRAIMEYNEIILHGNPLTQDYMHYAYLYDVRSKRDFEAAKKYYDKAIEYGRNHRDHYWFQAHQQRTMLLIRNNKVNENLDLLLNWLKEETENHEPYISLAFAYYEMGQYEKAYEYIKIAENFEVENITQLTVAGDICRKLKKYDEAILYFDKAYSIDSGCCACLYSKAFMYEEIGETEKAIKAWKYVIEWHIREGFDIGPEIIMPQNRIDMLINQN